MPPAKPTSTPIVLVVDDEPAIQASIGEFLQVHGFQVRHAANMAQAKQAAQQQQVDAVILDLRLGAGESGLDFLLWLRFQRRYDQTPVLVLTGQHMLSDQEEHELRQHHAYVFYKPQPLAELVDYLRRLTAEGPP